MKLLMKYSPLFFFGWFLGVLSALASPPAPRAITMAECLKMALQNNWDVRIQRLAPSIAYWQSEAALGAYDPVLGFKAGQNHVTMPQETDPNKIGPNEEYKQTSDSLALGLTGALPYGTRYELAHVFSHYRYQTDFTPPSRFPNNQRTTNDYESTLSLNLTQPLLRNFLMDQARQVILVSRKNLKISELALQMQLLNTATQVELAYYDLAGAQDLARVQEHALALAKTMLDLGRKQLDSGKATPLDVARAEAHVATIEGDLILAQQTLASAQNRLKTLITDDFKSLADVALTAADSMLVVPHQYDREFSWQQAMTTRPDLLQLRLESEKKDILVRFQKNQLLPAADLIGGVGARGKTSEADRAYGDLWEIKYPAYHYGLVVSLPIGNRAGRGNYQAAQAARKLAALEIKKAEQVILAEVDIAGSLIQTTLKRIPATRKAREYAQSALEMENKKLEVGASTQYVIQKLQQDLTLARQVEVQTATDYNKALVQLAYGEGSLLTKNGLGLMFK